MNKSIVIACMLLSLHCLAQKKKDFSGTVIRPFGVHVTGMDQFAEDRPKGSRYIQPMFSQAKVENVEANANMRYNAYSDEFEFLNSKNDTLVLEECARVRNKFVRTK